MDGVSLLNQYLPSWTPTSLPTSTSISTINPTNTAGLALTLLELQNAIQTETNTISLYFLSRAARGLLLVILSSVVNSIWQLPLPHKTFLRSRQQW